MTLPTPREALTPRDVPSTPAAHASAARPQPVLTRERVVATSGARIDAAVASSCGMLHANNEDAHSALDSAAPVFVVADGVGGGALASNASRELVTRLHTALEGTRADPSAVGRALLDADRAIGRSIASRTQASGAATVALCTGADPSLARWLVAWVGDCRVYRLRPRGEAPAQLLTIDDTYRHLQEPPPAGGSPDDPARMVGNGAVDAPNVRHVKLRAGDMLVLCSDGVHKHAQADDIGRVLREPASLGRRCARLIELARAKGSHDDATVLVVRRGECPATPLRRIVSITLLAALAVGVLLWLNGGALP
jgi:PPM family protein phosphatase